MVGAVQSFGRQVAVLLIAVTTFWVPRLASASLVYGVLSGGGFHHGRDTFKILATRNDKVPTNNRREYQVVLDPGTYRIEYTDEHGAKWTATIRAESSPIRQNIVLKKSS